MKKIKPLTREQKAELFEKEMLTGKKASQSQYIPLKDRLKLIRMEKMHGTVGVNFK